MCSLFVVAPIVYWGLVLGLCLFCSSLFYLILQSSLRGRESWLLYFCYALNVMSLLSFFDSS